MMTASMDWLRKQAVGRNRSSTAGTSSSARVEMNRRIEEYGGKLFMQLSEGVGRQVGTVLTCRNRHDPGRRERFGKSRSDPSASPNAVNKL